MARMILHKNKLKHNYKYLQDLFEKNNIHWGLVTKLLCGNEQLIGEIIKMGARQLCDARTTNLQRIKELDDSIETIYLKPPSRMAIPDIVRYADISFNTELPTIELLSKEAVRQDRIHKIMIMIEMGDLREGVMREEFVSFYQKGFRLPNIQIVGIGTNLTCLNGVLPNQDKLIQLSLYRQLIEAKFNKKLLYVSGGSSVTIPLLLKELLPAGVNHFRIGETLFFGNDLYHNAYIAGMEKDVFTLQAEIIELSEKPLVPSGEMGLNVHGERAEFNSQDIGKLSVRAILDLGSLDVDTDHLHPFDKEISIAGSSSDMMVLDLGDNPEDYKLGDMIEFKLDYPGALSILNSDYIDKKIA